MIHNYHKHTMFTPLFFMYFWHLNFSWLDGWRVDTKQVKKISNINSVIHACIVILSYSQPYDFNELAFLSITYYIYDAFVLVAMGIGTGMDIIMLLHHFSCIVGLHSSTNTDCISVVRSLFLLSEISNIPIFLMYHLRAVKYDDKKLMTRLILIEAASYFIFRMVMTPPYIQILIEKGFYMQSFIGICIYIMSGWWICKLVGQFLEQYKQECQSKNEKKSRKREHIFSSEISMENFDESEIQMSAIPQKPQKPDINNTDDSDDFW